MAFANIKKMATWGIGPAINFEELVFVAQRSAVVVLVREGEAGVAEVVGVEEEQAAAQASN
jgi:hypothetical protein